jgi:hypothetical protein
VWGKVAFFISYSFSLLKEAFSAWLMWVFLRFLGFFLDGTANLGFSAKTLKKPRSYFHKADKPLA